MVAAVLAAALASPAVPAASAGTYPMRSCNVPGHARAGATPWVWEQVLPVSTHNVCGTGGGFGFLITSPMPADASYDLTLRRPNAAIGIRQVKLWYAARLGATTGWLYVNTTTASDGENPQFQSLQSPGIVRERIEWLSPLYGTTTEQFRFSLYCTSSANCTPSSPIPLEIYGSEVTLSEARPPSVRTTGGSILAARVQGGTQTITFDADDDESGVARVEALLDGEVVATAEFTPTPRCRYDTWNACDPRAVDDLAVDTTAVPDGTYTLQLRAVDAAGNRTTTQIGAPITIANHGGTGTPNGDGATADARLTAAFATTGRRQMATSWGTRSVIRGRLTQPSGAPIRNATLDVKTRIATADARWRAERALRTDDRGRFTLILPAKTPSRRIRISYRATIPATSPAIVRDLALSVRPRIALRVSLNGTLVRYAGRLTSRPIPRTGITVRMQGRAVGGAWQTFAIRRSGPNGRFAGRYRLRVHRPGVRLQFRAFVPTARNVPFAAGHSAVVTRRVR